MCGGRDHAPLVLLSRLRWVVLAHVRGTRCPNRVWGVGLGWVWCQPDDAVTPWSPLTVIAVDLIPRPSPAVDARGPGQVRSWIGDRGGRCTGHCFGRLVSDRGSFVVGCLSLGADACDGH